MKTRSLVIGALASIGILAGALPVGATAPEPTGWDDAPDVIIGGGSDTSYNVMSDLMPLYNGAPGCLPDRSGSSANKGKCLPTQSGTVPTNGNFDHDIAVNAFPIGSGAAVCVIAGAVNCPQYNPPISFARSSRGPAGTELSAATFWGFARDGLAILSFGGRPAGNLGTDAQSIANTLFDIWTCAITDWSQIAGYTGPAGAIKPWGMNSSAGTFATFRDYVRTNSNRAGATSFDPNTSVAGCARQLTGNIQPEENDAKPILADSAADDDATFIWWGSFAEFSAFPFKRSTGQFFSLAGIAPEPASISSTTAGVQYPMTRLIYHVTKNTEADIDPAGGPNVIGGDTGTGGAVREFTEWLCKSSATHAINANTGQNYRAAIVAALNANGMVQVPSSLRSTGYFCNVQS